MKKRRKASTWKTYIIIPSYNEEKTIGEVITRLKKLPRIKSILIDDGSTDSTAEVAKKMGVVVIRHEKNKGKGEAIRTGLGYALNKKNAKYVAVIDCDMQYPPEEVTKLLEKLEKEKVDFVSGFRDPGEIPYANRFGNFIWKIFFNFLFKTSFNDTNCGLIAFNMKAAKILRKSTFGGYIIDNAIRMEIEKNNLKYAQAYVKVFYGKRRIAKFAKMAFGNFFFILMEGFKYRLDKI